MLKNTYFDGNMIYLTDKSKEDIEFEIKYLYRNASQDYKRNKLANNFILIYYCGEGE